MSPAPEHTRRNGRRQVSRLGRTVLLTNQEEVEETSHGAHYVSTDDSPHEIFAIPDPQGESQFVGDWGGETEYDMTFVTRDDGPVENIRDGGADHSSTIEYFGKTFRVHEAQFLYDVGVVTVGCEED